LWLLAVAVVVPLLLDNIILVLVAVALVVLGLMYQDIPQ
jgi:hypothetical protein